MLDTDLAKSVDLSFADFQKLGNGILPRLDAMRNHDGIYWSEANQGWIVTGHEELTKAASGVTSLRTSRRASISALVNGKMAE